MFKKFRATKLQLLLATIISLISLKAYLAGIVGYFLAKFFADRLSSFILSFGSYQFHFHHWLMGFVALGLTILYDIASLKNYLFFGFLGGVIVQGIFTYPDWHRILIRKK